MRIADVAMPECFDNLDLARDEAYCGLVLREVDLDQVAHFFVYAADQYAARYLG